MNFFKKLFASNKQTPNDSAGNNRKGINVPDIPVLKEVMTNDYFDKRYKELTQNDAIAIDGSVKMVESFFIETLSKKPVHGSANHPQNLDFAATNGYLKFCKPYGFGSGESAIQLAFAFSKYMIDNFDMIFYFDSEPEYKFRDFTIKKHINEAFISLYPLEYTLKVIANEKTFVDIVQKIEEQEKNIPNVDDLLKRFNP